MEFAFWPSFKSWGLSLNTGGDGDDAVTVGFRGWPIILWLSVSPPFKYRKNWKHRETELMFDGDVVQLSLGADPWCWPTPYGWTGRWSVRDFLLGAHVYREDSNPRVFDTLPIVMPERTYFWKGTIQQDSWKRPRWFRKTISRAHLDCQDGEQIPFPGKGENAWDCGEDASFGMTCPAETSTEACRAVHDSVMESRTRHGSGESWRPEKEAK